MKKGPIVLELENTDGPSPSDAPPVPDDLPQSTAVTMAASYAGRKTSGLARWFWRLLLGLIVFWASLTAWNFVTGLVQRNPVLGFATTGILGAFLFVCLLIAGKEFLALMRLGRMDRLQKRAAQAVREDDLKAAQSVSQDVVKLYQRRPDLAWSQARLRDVQANIFDADGILGAVETELLTPLDQAAQKEVEKAARQVAMMTALVPLALADVVTALVTNLRMIRSIAEIYGGRSGTLGSLRLTRSVLVHLVTTGAVAIGDDLIGSYAGGGILSKFSRRFGEGFINGALTARIGLAAMAVCRPLPFAVVKQPGLSSVITRAMTGFGAGKESRT
ncbi:MAG: YcjF family protein [Planktomarina sp.]